ncbi:thermostable hemolysin [Streptomyces sp. NPDC056190]|uniref:thermostable hemolysin n=1 Tax=Streptomyces sp. NPDC056190 TaxID=3345741 RepID=UPI0035DD2F57
MQINIARRGSALWSACADLARERYARDYGAHVTAAPDTFIALCDQDAPEGAPLACAGMTFGGRHSLLISSYIGGEAAEILTERLGAPCEASTLIEIGPLASREAGAGLKLIRMVPALGWCNGAEFLLCTVTQPLARTLARVGIEFTPLAPAREDLLPPEQQGRWGSYYATEPVAGYVDVRHFAAQFNVRGEAGPHLAVTWGQSPAGDVLAGAR